MGREGGFAANNVVPHLRALAEARVLSTAEAHTIAEQQAELLLKLHKITEPPVPEEVISKLPGMHVECRTDLPVSGLSWRAVPHHWRIVLAAHEPHEERRFSLAHEFKHVLDDPVIEFIHAHLSADERHTLAERLCDYFAACLLMPQAWIKRDWKNGKRSLEHLAERYRVSTHAVAARLGDLGLDYKALEAENGQEGGNDE